MYLGDDVGRVLAASSLAFAEGVPVLNPAGRGARAAIRVMDQAQQLGRVIPSFRPHGVCRVDQLPKRQSELVRVHTRDRG